MRTMIKLMAVCLSCILLGTASVQAAEKPLQMNKMPKKHPFIDLQWDYADAKYGYVSYGWKNHKTCVRYSIKKGDFQKKEIPLKGKAKKYTKNEYEVQSGCEWTDAKGNFYFISAHEVKGKYIGILINVDKKGNFIKKLSLNKWLKLPKNPPKNESNIFYMILIERVENKEVIASYYDSKKQGYVIFDRNTGKVKRQIVYSNDLYRESGGVIDCYQKTLLLGSTREKSETGKYNLLYGKIPKGKTISLPSGNKIKYQKVKHFKKGAPLPAKEMQNGKSLAAYKNQVYLLTSAGYYQIDTKDLSLKKLASAKGIPFWETESEYPVRIELMLLSPKKFIIKQCYQVDGEENIRDYTFWQGKIS